VRLESLKGLLGRPKREADSILHGVPLAHSGQTDAPPVSSKSEPYRQEIEHHRQLLLRLDSDENRAWEKYEGIRVRLKYFFENHRIVRPLELADSVLDRVAAILCDETRLPDKQVRDVAGFCVGVARKMALEQGKKEVRTTGIDDVPGGENLLQDLRDKPEDIANRIDHQRRLACLRSCLARLEPEERKLLLLFYSAEEKQQIPFRKELAVRLKISDGNLRLKACRIRARLEPCVTQCIRSSAVLRAASTTGSPTLLHKARNANGTCD